MEPIIIYEDTPDKLLNELDTFNRTENRTKKYDIILTKDNINDEIIKKIFIFADKLDDKNLNIVIINEDAKKKINFDIIKKYNSHIKVKFNKKVYDDEQLKDIAYDNVEKYSDIIMKHKNGTTNSDLLKTGVEKTEPVINLKTEPVTSSKTEPQNNNNFVSQIDYNKSFNENFKNILLRHIEGILCFSSHKKKSKKYILKKKSRYIKKYINKSTRKSIKKSISKPIRKSIKKSN